MNLTEALNAQELKTNKLVELLHESENEINQLKEQP